MKHLSLAILMLAQAPIIAAAQAAPPMRLSAPIASSNGHGITVNAGAAASAPATSARITLQLMSADNSLSLDARTLAPITDALVKAGAERSSIQLPLTFAAPGGTNQASISATVANPTVEQMRAGIVTVGSVVAAMKNIRLSSAQVQLSAANCTNELSAARQKAIAAAQSKAAAIAKELHVRVGNVINVQSFDQGSPDGTCRSQYFVGPMGPQFPYGDSSDADYVDVRIYENVTITYAIK